MARIPLIDASDPDIDPGLRAARLGCIARMSDQCVLSIGQSPGGAKDPLAADSDSLPSEVDTGTQVWVADYLAATTAKNCFY